MDHPFSETREFKSPVNNLRSHSNGSLSLYWSGGGRYHLLGKALKMESHLALRPASCLKVCTRLTVTYDNLPVIDTSLSCIISAFELFTSDKLVFGLLMQTDAKGEGNSISIPLCYNAVKKNDRINLCQLRRDLGKLEMRRFLQKVC